MEKFCTVNSVVINVKFVLNEVTFNTTQYIFRISTNIRCDFEQGHDTKKKKHISRQGYKRYIEIEKKNIQVESIIITDVAKTGI